MPVRRTQEGGRGKAGAVAVAAVETRSMRRAGNLVQPVPVVGGVGVFAPKRRRPGDRENVGVDRLGEAFDIGLRLHLDHRNIDGSDRRRLQRRTDLVSAEFIDVTLAACAAGK